MKESLESFAEIKRWKPQGFQIIKKSIMCDGHKEKFNRESLPVSLRELIISISTGVLIIFGISVLFYNSFFPIIIMSPYIYIHVRHTYKEKEKKRKQILCSQFKDAMESVSFSLNTGYSIENAFKEARNELLLLYEKDSPIVIEFNNIAVRLSRNENIEDILEGFARRSGVSDIDYFCTVFKYAKRCGGDLMGIISHTAKVIGEKNDIINEVQTIISGKRMEHTIMSCVPFAIILYLRVTAPEFIAPLYGNLPGVCVMTVCLGIMAASIYLGKRIVDIEI